MPKRYVDVDGNEIPLDQTSIALNLPLKKFDLASLTISSLSPEQASQLNQIAPRRVPNSPMTQQNVPWIHWCCRATLLNGNVIDPVKVESVLAHAHSLYNFNESMLSRPQVRVEEVLRFEESDLVLPREISDKLYRLGEDGMGYHSFRLIFRDGTRRQYVTGNDLDYVAFPPGLGPADVVDVEPRVRPGCFGFGGKALQSIGPTYCYFRDDPRAVLGI